MPDDLRSDLRERVERDMYDFYGLYGPAYKWVRPLFTGWARDLQAAEANLKTALADLGDERVRCLTARREVEQTRDALAAKVDALDASDEMQDEQIAALRDLALALAEAMYHTTWTVKYQAAEECRAALAALKGAHERIRDLAAKVREGR